MNIPPIDVIVAIVTALLVVGVIAWAVIRQEKTTRLKRRFGPEYDAAVAQFHSRSRAEAELAKREARVARMHIVPLTAADAARFSQSWKAIQGRFVDNPKGVVSEADHLVR